MLRNMMRIPGVFALLVHVVFAVPEGYRELASHPGTEALPAVTVYELEANGLEVVLAPQPEARAVAFGVVYRAGSRHEVEGASGAAHLLEHMMFKGTEKHCKEAGTGFDQELEGLGAETNAYTGRDATVYMTTLAPGNLPVIVGLEADRMRHLRLREADFVPERMVVLDEYDLADDEPTDVLTRALWSAALKRHPYGRPVLGCREEVKAMEVGALRSFYETHYAPDRAAVVVVGRFGPPEELLARISEEFGDVPRSAVAFEEVAVEEPAQREFRREVRGYGGGMRGLALGYRSPAATHPDYPALLVLAELLTGGETAPFFMDRASSWRLLDVMAMPEYYRDPSLLTVMAELDPEADHEKTEKAMLRVIDRVVKRGVDEVAVRAAAKRLEALTRFELDDTWALAESLADAGAVGDWALEAKLDAAIRGMSAEVVTAAARKWLKRDQCTAVWLVPGEAEAFEEVVEPELAAGSPAAPLVLPKLDAVPLPVPPKIAANVTRGEVGGIKVLVHPGGTPGLVYVSGAVALGSAAEEAAARLTAAMIGLGSRARGAEEIGEFLDRTGSVLEFDVIDGSLQIHGQSLSESFPDLLELLAEMLCRPSLARRDLAAMREQIIDEIGLERDDPGALGERMFRRASRSEAGAPPAADELVSQLRELRRGDLVRFHRERFKPGGTVLVFAGDLEAESCLEAVGKAFAGWDGAPPSVADAGSAEEGGSTRERLPVAGKESVQVLLGQGVGLRRGDEDTVALELAAAVLGDGFTSRLGHTVRDTEGLTYGVGAALDFPNGRAGEFVVFASFAPELLDRGLASIRREVEAWHRDGIGEGEFDYYRRALLGSWVLELSTTAGLADVLLRHAVAGLAPEAIDESFERLRMLDREEVHAAMRKHLDPAAWIEVASGNLKP